MSKKSISRIQQELQRLNSSLREIKYENQLKQFKSDIDDISRDKLIEILTTQPDSYFSSCYDSVCIYHERLETDGERDTRIRMEEQRNQQILEKKNELIIQLNAIEVAIETEKKLKDSKYDDPEYIEYLRLQAKMKEKGLLND